MNPPDRRSQRIVGAVLLAVGLLAVAAHPPRTPTLGPGSGFVDINTADADELQVLPGLGPALAQRIAHDRTLHGPFRAVNDLARVKGVGERTIKGLREFAVAGD